MKNYYLVIFLMLFSMFASSVHARKPKVPVEAVDEYLNKVLPADGTVWLCWYDGSQTIQCRPDETMDDEGVSIPLHTIPFDMALTGELAESVMCSGATKPCSVIFAANAIDAQQWGRTENVH